MHPLGAEQQMSVRLFRAVKLKLLRRCDGVLVSEREIRASVSARSLLQSVARPFSNYLAKQLRSTYHDTFHF